jgi:hypothetical protein
MGVYLDRFVLKSVNLTIPKGFDILSFFNEQRPDKSWQTDPPFVRDTFWSWGDGDWFKMEGSVTESGLEVKMFDLNGEGAWSSFNYIIAPLFRRLGGSLEFVAIWDGEVIRTKINNGILTEEEIEL